MSAPRRGSAGADRRQVECSVCRRMLDAHLVDVAMNGEPAKVVICPYCGTVHKWQVPGRKK